MIALYILLILFCIVLIIIVTRKLKLRNDKIPNPSDDAYLYFAETERSKNKWLFSPWTTTDEALLTIVKNYFPQVSIPEAHSLKKPDFKPVQITSLKTNEIKFNAEENLFIAVGGPPAALVAFQAVKNGKKVLYVDYNKTGVRPIWAGAANHGEPDVLTAAPAYVSGRAPFKFLLKEFMRFINPPRFDKHALYDDYPWLTLNISDWIRHPVQLFTGLRVAIANEKLARLYAKKNHAADVPEIFHELQKRTHNSGDYLEAFNNDEAKILREPRGSLIIAPDATTWDALLKDMELLKKEGYELTPITPEKAQQKYGFLPRHAVGMMEKTHDFIFEPQFLATINEQIKKQGGEVRTDWRLNRILVDTKERPGGVFEFAETTSEGKTIFHYRKFLQSHLSLGSTLFIPNQYDLVSLTGVSINALIFGVNLTGGPFVCGGVSNHIAVTPLAKPVTISSGENVSLIRIAAGGCVGPLNRKANRWYTYYGQTAINALHCLRKTLPAHASVKVLSVIGCNRVIGKDGRQVEIHPYFNVGSKKITADSITIQIGSAGGGLTQMGAVPKILADAHAH